MVGGCPWCEIAFFKDHSRINFIEVGAKEKDALGMLGDTDRFRSLSGLPENKSVRLTIFLLAVFQISVQMLITNQTMP